MARSDTTTDDKKYKAPALAKGLDILELLASANDGLTQVEIGKLLGRTTSEIFRMLVVLILRHPLIWENANEINAIAFLLSC